MRLLNCLTAVAVGLLTSAASCSRPIVVHSQMPPPAVCLERCIPQPPPLPRENDDEARRLWEIDSIWSYRLCVSLQSDCADQLEERIGSQKPPHSEAE